jgi:hypothetical protein
MSESKIKQQDNYTGPTPTVFKKIGESDVKVNPFQTYKSWTVISGSSTSSVMPLTAIYSDTNILPALGTELIYNDAKNIDNSLQTITYFSINHLFYKRKTEPYNTFGPTDLNRTNKLLFESASILSFPMVKVGEGIKPASFTLTASYNDNTVYGLGTYGTSSYSGTPLPLYIKSDRYGNLYNTAFLTSSIVSGVTYYEGFNEYFDTSRITYNSSGVTYVDGIATTNGTVASIGKSAQFDGAGYIQTKLDGDYSRDVNYAISFFISGANTTSANELVLSKASSSLQPQYPFRVELSGSNQLIFSAAGSTTFKLTITSSVAVNTWTHILCQKSGSALHMYVNGALHASASSTLLQYHESPFTASARIDNYSDLFIGGFDTTSMNLQGKLDEIRIFNKALTVSEIGYLSDRTEGGTFLQTNCIGNVFAKQGQVVISTPDYRFNDILNLPYTASYRSTKTINELNVIANVDSSDFNVSSNLSLTADNDITYRTFATGSAFAPYITTVGLYDDAGQLLAIGKMAQPIRKRNDVDMNFLIRIDLDKNIA